MNDADQKQVEIYLGFIDRHAPSRYACRTRCATENGELVLSSASMGWKDEDDKEFYTEYCKETAVELAKLLKSKGVGKYTLTQVLNEEDFAFAGFSFSRLFPMPEKEISVFIQYLEHYLAHPRFPLKSYSGKIVITFCDDYNAKWLSRNSQGKLCGNTWSFEGRLSTDPTSASLSALGMKIRYQNIAQIQVDGETVWEDPRP